MTRIRVLGLLTAAALFLVLVASHRGEPSGVAVAAREETPGISFMVEVSGVNVGLFKSVDGLSIENDVIEFQDGDDLLLRKRPGRAKYANITLKRGFSGGQSLFEEWHQSIVDGTAQDDQIQRPMTLTLLNQQGKPIARWSLTGAFPASFAIASATDNSGMAIEKIEIAVEKVERVLQ